MFVFFFVIVIVCMCRQQRLAASNRVIVAPRTAYVTQQGTTVTVGQAVPPG